MVAGAWCSTGMRACAATIESHPLGAAMGRRAEGKPLTAREDDASARARECIVAGTAHQSGALEQNAASDPEALVALLQGRGLEVRSPCNLWCTQGDEANGKQVHAGDAAPHRRNH
jgi:hypothetical protein